jgi:hypothetical protein
MTLQGPDGVALMAVQEGSYARASAGVRVSWPPGSALDAAGLMEFLDGQVYGVLAVTLPGGRPLARPVSYSTIGTSFWVASVEGARLRALRVAPYASLVVSVGDRKAVAVDGPVELHRPTDVRTSLEPAWSMRHGGWPSWAEAFIELKPERL